MSYDNKVSYQPIEDWYLGELARRIVQNQELELGLSQSQPTPPTPHLEPWQALRDQIQKESQAHVASLFVARVKRESLTDSRYLTPKT